MNSIQSYKDLMVWQKAMDLVEIVYRITKEFPREEIYGLTAQIRRSVISIPSNIAEGQRRHHLKEYVQFLFIAKGSVAELETQIEIAKRLSFLSNPLFTNVESLLTEISKMLTKLISNLTSGQRTTTYNPPPTT